MSKNKIVKMFMIDGDSRVKRFTPFSRSKTQDLVKNELTRGQSFAISKVEDLIESLALQEMNGAIIFGDIELRGVDQSGYAVWWRVAHSKSGS